MKEITQEYLQLYLKESEFDLLPTHNKISYPLICKYLRMLEQGQSPPAIKTELNAIVDGHHRYISGHLYGSKPEQCKWIRPKANTIKVWDSVTVESSDYESGYDENLF